MRVPNREVSIFSLSALDVLATSTGVFVLFVVILLPYYQMSEDAGAALDRRRAEIGRELQDRARLLQSAEADRNATAALRGDSRALATEAAALRSRTEQLQREAATLRAKLRSGPVHNEKPRGNLDLRFIDKLDLVFLIDTTRSMQAALDELTASLSDIVAILNRLVRSLRVGLVAYRDAELGGPVTRALPPTPTTAMDRIQGFVADLGVATSGGRTIEEDVYTALREADAFDYRPGAVRQWVLIGDAAAHPDQQAATIALARRFHRQADSRLSTLLVPTETLLRYGRDERSFYAAVAAAGGGEFSEHRGRMVESILLSVLKRQ